MKRSRKWLELYWVAPLALIALMSLGLLRALPHQAPPAHGRTVTGDDGQSVVIEEPFRGICLTYGFLFPNWYLEDTHAPDLLVYAGTADQRKWFSGNALRLAYPQLLNKESLWDPRVFRFAHDGYIEIEAMMAYNPGVYLGVAGDYTPIPLMRRMGLPTLSNWGHAKGGEKAGLSTARVNAALIGNPALGDAHIAEYWRDVNELKQELHPGNLTLLPKVLLMSASRLNRRQIGVVGDDTDWSNLYYPRAGVANAASGHQAMSYDAERILAIDPETIVLAGIATGPRPWESPQEFMHDPRWQGLQAVQQKRVYRMAGVQDWSPGGLMFIPMRTRWLAELLHPELLQPRLRQILRDHFRNDFNTSLTDEEIDKQLRIDENAGSVGYERFTRSGAAARNEKSLQ